MPKLTLILTLIHPRYIASSIYKPKPTLWQPQIARVINALNCDVSTVSNDKNTHLK